METPNPEPLRLKRKVGRPRKTLPPGTPDNAALDRAREIPPPEPAAQCAVDPQAEVQFVVETATALKTALVNAAITFKYVPDTAEMRKHGQLLVPTQVALAANAPLIAPKIRENLSGWTPVIIALAIEGLVTGLAIWTAHKALVPPKKAPDKPQEKTPDRPPEKAPPAASGLPPGAGSLSPGQVVFDTAADAA